ncbi:MAG TPA: hypothetical protein VFA74_19560 [Terriglobales bacterium]|nr:hypothetical protein [Terriglobales bacterium]
MTHDLAVLYSFCLYVLYVLLPLIPAILIFRLFPETKVTVSGPLQNLTVNATGAFAAYVVTVALGFFLVKNVETQINATGHYAVEGEIVDLGNNQYVNSEQFYSRYITAAVDAQGKLLSRNYYFVILLDHPVQKPETVWLQYWELNSSAGTGSPPIPKTVQMALSPTNAPQRYRLRILNNQPVVEELGQ